VVLRKARSSDSREIAILYKRIFYSSHLNSHYSVPLLCKYFNNLLELNEFSYIIEEDDKLLGFLIGGPNIGQALKKFTKRYIFFITIELFKHPKYLLKKIQGRSSGLTIVRPKMRLFIIGADLTSGKKGIGSMLLTRFETDIQMSGFTSYGLNVRSDNFTAQQFYLNRGLHLNARSNDTFYYIKNF
jgi:ribosomal protein S18 acetylase RimI-like enzyme